MHGVAGGVYSLISEQHLQVNARFVFLSSGECPPVLDVVPSSASPSACWSHAGSYVGELSIQAVVDGRVHAALVVAGAAVSGFAMVQVDGTALGLGGAVSFGSELSINGTPPTASPRTPRTSTLS